MTFAANAFHLQMQEVLSLEMELVMSEGAATLPGMRPALARLANALVAVLGPELTPGSMAYSRTRCLLLDLQVHFHSTFLGRVYFIVTQVVCLNVSHYCAMMNNFHVAVWRD